MKLAAISVDQFGARSNLRLDELSGNVNVIYGANGSGKTTLINFMTWVLYGSTVSTHAPFLATDGRRAGGSLVVERAGRRFTINREGDGTAGGKLTVQDRSGNSSADHVHRDRWMGIERDEYQHIFSFGFDQPPRLDQLVRVACEHGFNLLDDKRQVQQLRELRQRLNNKRQLLDALPALSSTLDSLQQRHRERMQRIDRLHEARRQRLATIDHECCTIVGSMTNVQRRLERLKTALNNTETTIQARRRQLDEAVRAAERVRRERLEQRRQKVAEIDDQIQNWGQVVQRIRDRLERLNSRLSSYRTTRGSTEIEESDLRNFLHTLGFQISDIEQDLNGACVENEQDYQSQVQYLRSILSSALRSMRDDVSRLRHAFDAQRDANLHAEYSTELRHLRRCETELTELIDQLSRRRESLLNDVSGIIPLRIYDDTTHENRSSSLINNSGRSFDARTWTTWSSADPVLQARLEHLTRMRNRINTRIRETRSTIHQLRQRRQQLEASRNLTDEDRHIEHIRRAVEQLESHIRTIKQREKIEHDVRVTVAEIRRIKHNLRPSEVMREASAMLLRITGRYSNLRITGDHEIRVDDATRQPIAYEQLSRGTRDQVYLCLALALVAANHRQGKQLPMVLNDVFINIDSERAKATAGLLSDFSRAGHQILIFTRHQHVMSLFSQRSARLYSLQHRKRYQPRVEFDYDQHSSSGRSTHSHLKKVTDHLASEFALTPPLVVVDEQEFAWENSPGVAAETNDTENPTVAMTPSSSDSVENELVSSISRDDAVAIETFGSLDDDMVGRLHSIGVTKLCEFLRLDPEEAEQQLGDGGITADRIERWQSETSLQSFVGLTGREAELLVACGIDDPEELAQIDIDVLHERIEKHLANDDSREHFGSSSRYDRSRLTSWIRTARASRYQPYRSRSRKSGRSRVSEVSTRSRSLPRRETGASTKSKDSRTRSTEKVSRNTKQSTRKTKGTSSRRSNRSPVMNEQEDNHKFYLESSDPVVDAPSISRKTAKRLHAIGVNSVADLLHLDPENAADRLNHSRATAETIRDWQAQSRLVSCVPNLRGHDAQILVACDVTDAESLANFEPTELWKNVELVVETAEGKSLLRGNKKPDLKEVTDWIGWAQSARQSKAA